MEWNRLRWSTKGGNSCLLQQQYKHKTETVSLLWRPIAAATPSTIKWMNNFFLITHFEKCRQPIRMDVLASWDVTGGLDALYNTAALISWLQFRLGQKPNPFSSPLYFALLHVLSFHRTDYLLLPCMAVNNPRALIIYAIVFVFVVFDLPLNALVGC